MKKLGLIAVLLTQLTLPLAQGQNLVRNHDFSDLNSCVDIKDRGGYIQSSSLNWRVPMQRHWFIPPDTSVIRPIPLREMLSYVSIHKNCPFIPIDTVELMPYLLFGNRSCNDSLKWFMPQPIKGDGYLALRLLDSFDVQPFFAYSTITTCPPNSPGFVPLSPPLYANTPTTDPNATHTHYGSRFNGRRTFAETRLKEPLVSQKEYVLEFWTARKWNSYYTLGEISAYFSVDTFRFLDYKRQNIVPQVTSTQDSIYNDTSNFRKWTHVKQSFVAEGGEEFLTLGNFNNYGNPDFPYRLMHFAPIPTQVPFRQYTFHGDYFFAAIYLYDPLDSVFSVHLPNDTLLCPGDSLTLHAFHTDSFKIEATKTFQWSTGATDSSITIKQPGTYWVEVAYDNRWKQRDSITVRYYPPYQSGLAGLDTTLCAGDSLWVQAALDTAVSHQWLHGPSTAGTWLSDSGRYILQSSSYCGIWQDTLQVRYHPALEIDTSGLSGELCPQNDSLVLELDPLAFGEYRWSNGQIGPKAVYRSPGDENLQVISACDTLNYPFTLNEKVECDTSGIYIASAFTPNGDGLNDAFEIVNLPAKNELQIFNRWGGIVFQAKPYRNDWQGTDPSGGDLPGGVYVFVLRYQFDGAWQVKRGHFTLVR